MAVAAMAALSACGGNTDGGDGVASIEGRDDAGEASAGDGAPRREAEPAEVEDAMVEFGACLRDEGMELPASLANDETIQGPGPDIEAKYPGYGAAYETCIPIVETVTGSMEMTPEEIAMMQDHMLAAARCMRERGYDYPDPVFGEDGQLTGFVEIPGLTTEEQVRELNECGDEVRDEHPASPYDE